MYIYTVPSGPNESILARTTIELFFPLPQPLPLAPGLVAKRLISELTPGSLESIAIFNFEQSVI